VNGELEFAQILMYYTSIFLEGLEKITKNLSQDSRSPSRDLKPGPPEYEAGALTTQPRRSVPSTYVYFFLIHIISRNYYRPVQSLNKYDKLHIMDPSATDKLVADT
jgi:hypothetical protein